MIQEGFLRREVARFGRPVFRLGLSGSFGLDEAGCREALEQAQYVFWSPRMRGLTPALREALARDRERYVVATGPLFGFLPGSLRKAVDGARRALGIEVLDVLQLFWLGRMSAFTGAVQAGMAALQDAGRVRWLCASIHDRPRAGRLAADSILDALMVRYNAAHPGAEREIFPHLAARRPAVIAYTATAWRKLLAAPKGWEGDVPTAGDCYRFCLSSPYVDVALCGPRTVAQWRENLAALERGPLSAEEDAWMRSFGRAVHG